MATFKLLAPVTGYLTSTDYYDCPTNSCYHCVCNGYGCSSCSANSNYFSSSQAAVNAYNPRDLGVSASGQAVKAYGKPGGSIKVATPTWGCCQSCPSSVFANVRACYFYNLPNGPTNPSAKLMGVAIYAHLDQPVGDGTYNQDALIVGKIPATGTCGCYGGTHSHIERRNGTALALNCGQAMTSGVTQIYQWTY